MRAGRGARALRAGVNRRAADLTEAILRASQDESAWAVQHRSDVTRLASAASAVFFRLVGSTELVTAEEVASLYATRARKR